MSIKGKAIISVLLSLMLASNISVNAFLIEDQHEVNERSIDLTSLRLESELLNFEDVRFNPDATRVIVNGDDINKIRDLARVSYINNGIGYVAATTKEKIPLLSTHVNMMNDMMLEFDQVRDASRLGIITGSDQVLKDYSLTGKGVKIAIVDTGSDLSSEDLSHALARDENNMPIMIDTDGHGIVLTKTKFVAKMTPQGKLLNSTSAKSVKEESKERKEFVSDVYYNKTGVFLRLKENKNGTKFEIYNPLYPYITPLVINATADKDWKIGNSLHDFISSKSGEYHMGFFVQIQFHLGRPGLIIVPVLVTDSKEKGVYDTIIPDMSSAWADFSKFELRRPDVKFDFDFTDEKPIRLGSGNEFLTYDDKNDGKLDLSAGIVGARVLDLWGAFSDKAKIHDYLGAVNATLLKPIDTNGTYFGVMYDFFGHGTASASTIVSKGKLTYDFYKNSTKYSIRGVAPDAKIIPVKALWLGDVAYGWLWVSGFDQVNGTWKYAGKHKADIINNSWGISTFPALDYGPGYDIISVLADIISIPGSLAPDYPGTLVVSSAGNNGYAYGTLGPPATSQLSLTVGATTNNVFVGYGFTKKEPRFGNSTQYYDDIADFSSRGPSMLGDVKPEIVSTGAYAFVPMLPNVKYANNDTEAFWLFGGTSMAAPMVSGVAALAIEGLKKAKMDANPPLLKTILISSASDLGHDPFTQGSGKANITNVLNYIKNGFIVYTEDSYPNSFKIINSTKLEGFDYNLNMSQKVPMGKWYAGFLDKNQSVSARFFIDNPSNSTLKVEIEPTTLALIKHAKINGTTEVRKRDPSINATDKYIPNYIKLRNVTDIPEDSDLMVAKIHFPFETFMNTTDIYAHSLRISSLYLYDWVDRNNDKEIAYNETSMVNRGGAWGTVQQVTVSKPSERLKNPLIGIYPVPKLFSYWVGDTKKNSTAMNYTLTVDFYKKVKWDLISVSKNIEIAPRSKGVFNATINIPPDMPAGIYQGYITVSNEKQRSNIPVSFAIPMHVSSKDVPLVIDGSGKEYQDPFYDNTELTGAFDMFSRYNAGTWRYYHFDIIDPTINAVSVKVSWKNNWTSVNAMVTDPSGKIVATSVPAGVFKTFLGWASNDWLGSTRTSQGGGFYPAANNGGNSTVLYLPVNSTGIYTLLLHNTLFHARNLTEPLIIEIKPTTLLPDTRPPIIIADIPKYVRGIIDTSIEVEDENLEEVMYAIDDGPLRMMDNRTITIDTEALNEGMHQLVINARDTVGHRSSKNLFFIADNTPPKLTVRSPDDGIVISDLFNVELEVSDSSLSKISVVLPNGSRIDNTKTFSVNTTSLADGEYKLIVSAEDGPGNISEIERRIIIDRTLPSIEIKKPSNGEKVSGDVEIEYEIKDSNLKDVTLSIGEKSVKIENTGSYTLDTTTLFDGEYNLEIKAEDMAGNTNSKSISIVSTNYGVTILNAELLGIAIGVAIGAGVSAAIFIKYRRK